MAIPNSDRGFDWNNHLPVIIFLFFYLNKNRKINMADPTIYMVNLRTDYEQKLIISKMLSYIYYNEHSLV